MKRSAFTLIEMLAVITIVVILAALTVKLAQYGVKKGLESRCVAEIRALGAALDAYKLDHFKFPDMTSAIHPGCVTPVSNADALYRGVTGIGCTGMPVYFAGIKRGKGGNVQNDVFIDPYGAPYNYRPGSDAGAINKASFDLWSNGPDGVNNNGSADDIAGWRL